MSGGLVDYIAHDPPHTSKWNPIEHRLFPHITRSLKGMILTSYELVKELIGKTTTRSELRCFLLSLTECMKRIEK